MHLQEFLDMCIRSQSENQFDPVINYALTVIENHGIEQFNVELLETFLLKATVLSPRSMSEISTILINLHYKTNRLSVKRVCDQFRRLLEKTLENGQTYEAVWLLYTPRGLKRPIYSGSVCDIMENIESSVLALVLLDMKSRNIWSGKLPVGSWENRITRESVLTDGSWLLGYEGYRNGWLRDHRGLMRRAFFVPMADRPVKFYDPTKNVQSTTGRARRRRRVRRTQYLEVRRVVQMLRGFVGYS